jgi:hypothetical protein
MIPAIKPSPFSRMTGFGYHKRGTSCPSFRGNKKTLHLVMYSGPQVGRVPPVGQADQAKEGRMEDNLLVKPSFSATINTRITHIRRRYRMTRIAFLLVAVVTVAGGVASMAPASAHGDGEAGPILVTKIPPGYRDWRLVSVAHEEGQLNDIRAILGNDVAMKSYREGKLPFPEGTIIARIAWNYVPSEENNKIFGRAQSFVAGSAPAWYLQFMVKDSKKYAATGGWGYAQFDKDDKPGPEADLKKCFPCHQAIKDRDFVFTRYSP